MSLEVVDFQQKEIKFLAKFTESDEVSTGTFGFDTMVIEFIDPGEFKTLEYGIPLDNSSFIDGVRFLYKSNSPIIQDEQVAENLEGLSTKTT